MIYLSAIDLEGANAIVTKWHSHHKKVRGHKFSIAAELDVPYIGREVAGVVIVGRPVAQALDDKFTLEVTRLACRGTKESPTDKNVASKLLSAASDAAFAQGIRLLVSYTRKDEDGKCYKACGWVPVADVKGRPWTGGNKEQRWLPGLYEPTTEIVDRVRWEKRPEQHIRCVIKMIFALGELARAHERQRKAA